MKNLTKRVVSFILIMAIIVSLSSSAFASGYQASSCDNSGADKVDVTLEIQEACNILSPQAKQIFLKAIANNQELLEYYQKYIDPSFIPAPTTRAVPVSDPLSSLNRNLNKLKLPNPVVVVLLNAASTMLVAVSEGGLVIGKVAFALTAANAVVVLATYWTEVEPQFPAITKAFQDFFGDSAKAIQRAFQDLKNSIVKTINTPQKPSVSYNVKHKTVTFKGVTYNCRAKASEMSRRDYNRGDYFVTLRIGDMLYCDVKNAVNADVAKAILGCNNSYIGIMAMSSSSAVAICSPIKVDDGVHQQGMPGYFPHYHPKRAPHAHCWYLMK